MSEHPTATRAKEKAKARGEQVKGWENRAEEIGFGALSWMDKPIARGWWWKRRYYCPEHPEVLLKTGGYSSGYSARTTVYYDGCGYFYSKENYY